MLQYFFKFKGDFVSISFRHSDFANHHSSCEHLSGLLKEYQVLVEGMESCEVGDPWTCKKHHPLELYETALRVDRIIDDLIFKQSELSKSLEEITEGGELAQKELSDSEHLLSSMVAKAAEMMGVIYKRIKPEHSETGIKSSSDFSLSSRLKPLTLGSPPPVRLKSSEVVIVRPPPKLQSERHKHCLDLLAELRLEDEHLASTAERLGSIKERAIFKVFDENYQQVASRPYFHIYFLHRKECPEKREQLNHGGYGEKAFLNQEAGYSSTLSERQRVVARTQVEVALHGLDESISADDFDKMSYYFECLEKTLLDARDGVKDQRNIAHLLFQTLYECYQVDLDKPGTKLPQPGADFGRNAFIGKAGFDVSKSYREAAFSLVILDLRAAWKI